MLSWSVYYSVSYDAEHQSPFLPSPKQMRGGHTASHSNGGGDDDDDGDDSDGDEDGWYNDSEKAV